MTSYPGEATMPRTARDVGGSMSPTPERRRA